MKCHEWKAITNQKILRRTCLFALTAGGMYWQAAQISFCLEMPAAPFQYYVPITIYYESLQWSELDKDKRVESTECQKCSSLRAKNPHSFMLFTVQKTRDALFPPPKKTRKKKNIFSSPLHLFDMSLWEEKGESQSISLCCIEKCLLPGLAWKRLNYHNRHEQCSRQEAFHYKPKLLGQILEDGDSHTFSPPFFSLF